MLLITPPAQSQVLSTMALGLKLGMFYHVQPLLKFLSPGLVLHGFHGCQIFGVDESFNVGKLASATWNSITV